MIRADIVWGLLLIATVSICQRANASEATITDDKGGRTQVDDLRAHTHFSCKGFMYHLGIPTETDLSSDSMLFEVGGGNENLGRGQYVVEVPFSIVNFAKKGSFSVPS